MSQSDTGRACIQTAGQDESEIPGVHRQTTPTWWRRAPRAHTSGCFIAGSPAYGVPDGRVLFASKSTNAQKKSVRAATEGRASGAKRPRRASDCTEHERVSRRRIPPNFLCAKKGQSFWWTTECVGHFHGAGPRQPLGASSPSFGVTRNRCV
jgi:hypothetical protein